MFHSPVGKLRLVRNAVPGFQNDSTEPITDESGTLGGCLTVLVISCHIFASLIWGYIRRAR
jgi:hypothetical protein